MNSWLRIGFGAAFLLYGTPSQAAEPKVPTQFPATVPAIGRSTLGNVPPNSAAYPTAQQLGAVTASLPQPSSLSAISAKAAPNPAVPLRDLVISYVDRGDQDADQDCLANAVYFEARSEPLEGQLAVAQVILNRAASGTFPTSVCAVVTQPAQFSFVRRGKLPSPDKASDCWHRALAIADIARKRVLAGEITSTVLWYHAIYVSPSWDRQRTRFAQIGKHVFFN